MDKSVGRDKRRKDKHHKKPPPVKSSSAVSSSGKSQKEPERANQTAAHISAPLIVYDDPYSGRPIESNWNSSRNLPSGGSDSEDEQLRAADFEKLLQMPPSVSGHFLLSTEKHWTTDSEEGSISAGGKSGQQYGQYFQIDTKQLNASLATIPFYERNGYPCEIFSKQEIDSMKLKAQFESKKYQELCQRLESTRKMGDSQPPPPPPPVKCLIGVGALPPPVDQGQQHQQQWPGPPVRPMPCLIGPMALPPELRNDPNVTGSYASSSAAVAERMGEVNLTEGGSRAVSDAVPIESGNSEERVVGEVGASGKEKKVEGKAGDTKSSAKETKEDIQQWLDDILDM